MQAKEANAGVIGRVISVSTYHLIMTISIVLLYGDVLCIRSDSDEQTTAERSRYN